MYCYCAAWRLWVCTIYTISNVNNLELDSWQSVGRLFFEFAGSRFFCIFNRWSYPTINANTLCSLQKTVGETKSERKTIEKINTNNRVHHDFFVVVVVRACKNSFRSSSLKIFLSLWQKKPIIIGTAVLQTKRRKASNSPQFDCRLLERHVASFVETRESQRDPSSPTSNIIK